MEFRELDPLLHNELRLKVMAALDSLDDADFVYLRELTKATAGNLSVQITKLEEAGYIKVSRSGEGRGSHTVCHITNKGVRALLAYQKALMGYFQRKTSDFP
ncbi:MAG: transcriptional regulator [Bacteroidales bacterium]|nr:transcriptional regulator [Bacteroidales bacterium]